MRIVSWGAQGFIPVELVPQAEIIKSARYLQALLRDRRAGKREVIMQHEKARGPSVLVGAWTGGIGMP
jgi:hypothetical protein